MKQAARILWTWLRTDLVRDYYFALTILSLAVVFVSIYHTQAAITMVGKPFIALVVYLDQWNLWFLGSPIIYYAVVRTWKNRKASRLFLLCCLEQGVLLFSFFYVSMTLMIWAAQRTMFIVY